MNCVPTIIQLNTVDSALTETAVVSKSVVLQHISMYQFKSKMAIIYDLIGLIIQYYYLN